MKSIPGEFADFYWRTDWRTRALEEFNVIDRRDFDNFRAGIFNATTSRANAIVRDRKSYPWSWGASSSRWANIWGDAIPHLVRQASRFGFCSESAKENLVEAFAMIEGYSRQRVLMEIERAHVDGALEVEELSEEDDDSDFDDE